ncbi:MAG: hypothetical protein B6242_04450 [Anaerolineaceae bacterium 4572_78]|nr:MAG: hypothetical protein B6242_04450 [Anaerolineaceae bacterium 4572_78]
MTISSLDQYTLKDILKQVFSEVLHDQRDFFYDLMTEVLEDLALINAIKKGENDETVSRSEVFALLNG